MTYRRRSSSGPWATRWADPRESSPVPYRSLGYPADFWVGATRWSVSSGPCRSIPPRPPKCSVGGLQSPSQMGSHGRVAGTSPQRPHLARGGIRPTSPLDVTGPTGRTARRTFIGARNGTPTANPAVKLARPPICECVLGTRIRRLAYYGFAEAALGGLDTAKRKPPPSLILRHTDIAR